jgi:hypothetical protein
VINISGRDVVACERGSIAVVEHSDSECVSLQKCSRSAVAGGRSKRAHGRFIPMWTRGYCGVPLPARVHRQLVLGGRYGWVGSYGSRLISTNSAGAIASPRTKISL